MPNAVVLREYGESDRDAALKIFDSNTPEFFAAEERTDFAAFLASPAATVLVLVDAAGHVIGLGGYYARGTDGDGDSRGG